ncbi:MAG: phytoene desaturase family protein [Candidatus Aminicenantales bacterium]
MKNVAIIGSGLGGLIAGNLIARRGHKVTIFESHTAPGGYTAGFRRKGYYFESGTLSFESSGVLFKALDDLGLRDKIHFTKIRGRWVSPFFNFPFESYGSFKRDIHRGFPAEEAALDSYFSELDPIVEAFRPFIVGPNPSQFSGLAAVRAALPYVVKGGRIYRIIKKYGRETVEDIAGRHFPKGTPLFRLFAGLGYPRMGIAGLGGLFVALFEDYWHVVEGMQHLADILADAFREAGGTLKLGAPVEKILTRNGAAVSLVSKGETFETDVVIAACDYKSTFLKLLDNPALVPEDRLEKIRNAAVSEGIFTVYLGLDMSNAELEKALGASMVSYDPLAHDLDYRDPGDPGFFGKCGLSFYAPSLVNPKLAPEGKSSLMIQAVCPIRWQDNWHQGDREKYTALKAAAARTIIGRAEAIIPNLASRIEFEDAATPLTYERYTANTDGATSAWSWDPNTAFYQGGVMARMNVETPVRNLLIGSCWISQIGGIPSAVMAAYLCSRKIGR